VLAVCVWYGDGLVVLCMATKTQRSLHELRERYSGSWWRRRRDLIRIDGRVGMAACTADDLHARVGDDLVDGVLDLLL
jgi:hypothetical protein